MRQIPKHRSDRKLGIVRRPRARRLVLIIGLFALLSFSVFPRVWATPTASDPVTLTRHANLGFNTAIPLSVDTGIASPPCQLTVVVCLFHAAVAFSGTLSLAGTLGTDIALTYNPSDLNTPGGALPVSIKYTATPGGSTVGYTLAGTLTLNFDGCTNCPAALPVTGSSTPMSFTALMGSDASVTIPGTSTGITLSVAGVPIITASLSSGLTLSPAPPGPSGSPIPGLGGAAIFAGGLLPLEWDTSGQSNNATFTVPSNPTGTMITLGPIVHWLGTAGDLKINLHWTSQLQAIVKVVAALVTAGVCLLANCSISDPSPITVFSGGLGPVYTSAGLDTAIGNAIGPPAGSLVAGRVGAGFVPVPLTSPELASIPPLSAGSITFAIPAVSIDNAPTGAVLSGDAIGLSAVPNGGTAPFNFAWTKNGVAFAATQDIMDTPALGSTTYGVTITDSQGAVSNTAMTTVGVYDFTVSGSPTSLQVLTTGSNAYGITEALIAGSSTSGLPTIGLSVTGLPSGAAQNFAPPSGTASGFASTLTITTTNTVPGTYPLTLIGTDARASIGGSQTSSLSLTVLTPAQAIPNVENTVNSPLASGVLNKGQANSLLTKLANAIADLSKALPASSSACNVLSALVNQIESYVASGILTQAQADTILGGPLGVFAIMAAIPCS